MELYMYSCKLKCYNIIVNTLLKCVCWGGGSGEDFGGGGHKHTSQQKYIPVQIVFILHKPLHLCQQY